MFTLYVDVNHVYRYTSVSRLMISVKVINLVIITVFIYIFLERYPTDTITGLNPATYNFLYFLYEVS